jgi:DNA-binding NarL/FixJ family response regulator
MAIRVLLADDSDCMLQAMRQLLEEEPQIEIVGQASSFAETMVMVGALKPEVLLLDLHLAQCGDFTPEFVRTQLEPVKNVLAVSFSNDDEAHELAKSYGAATLLDKMSLYAKMIPAIKRCVGGGVEMDGRRGRETGAPIIPT